MRTYEITFIDIGFLFSSELWLSWLVVGLVVGYFVLLENCIGSASFRAAQAKKMANWPFGWLLFAALFPVFFWPVALFIWARGWAAKWSR